MIHKKKKIDEAIENKILKAVIIGETFTRHLFPLNEGINDLLIPVCSIPYIEYVIDFLLLAGVSQMIFVVKNNHNSLKDYIKKNLKDIEKKTEKIIVVIHSEEINSVGDCLREVYKTNLITNDFILIRGLTICNFNLEKAYNFHKEKKNNDEYISMTTIFTKHILDSEESKINYYIDFMNCSLNYNYNNNYKTSYDENIIVIEKNTNRILQFESLENIDNVRLNTNVINLKNFNNDKKDCKNFDREIRTDLYDSFIDICSPEILSHFTDNFDYLNIKEDLYKNYLCSEMYLDTFYCYEVESNNYCMCIKNMENYIKISNQIINRWTYPLCLDNMNISKKLDIYYIYSCNNLYLGTGKEATNMISTLNLSRLNSLSDFRTSNLGNIDSKVNIVKVKIDLNSNVNSCSIGSGTFIDSNCLINNSVIGKNCYIGKHTVIRNSIILNNVDIGNNIHIINSVICSATRIRSGIISIINSYLGCGLDINESTESLKFLVSNFDKKIINIRISTDVDALSNTTSNNMFTTINENENTAISDDEDSCNNNYSNISISYNVIAHNEFLRSLDNLDLMLVSINFFNYINNKNQLETQMFKHNNIMNCDLKEIDNTKKNNGKNIELEEDDFTQSSLEDDDDVNYIDEINFEDEIIEIFNQEEKSIDEKIQELNILRKTNWNKTQGEGKKYYN